MSTMELEALQNIQLKSLLDSLISLFVAFLLGASVGYERQYRQRTAGLRTNVLVAVGAAAFVDIANRLHGHEGAVHVIAYVVSGIGFLGAGVLMKDKGSVSGLNTAATLWASAAIGASAGADLIIEATLITLFVLAGNTVLRPIAQRINRQPISTEETELGFVIYLIADRNEQRTTMHQFENLLQQHKLPVLQLNIHPFADHEVEIEASLGSQSTTETQLDRLITDISQLAHVKQAFWSRSFEA